MSERERFLREFERRLRLRVRRRADALAEIESHIEEALQAGKDEPTAIARLGDPWEVARALNRTEARRTRIVIAAAGLVFAVATAVAAGWFQSGRSSEPPAPALHEHREMAPPEVAIPLLEREWRTTIEALARVHPEERFTNRPQTRAFRLLC